MNQWKRFSIAILFILLQVSLFAQNDSLPRYELQIDFASGVSALDDASKAKLDSLLREIPADSIQQIFIEGNADQIGNEASNLLLSENRARTILRHFFYQGVPLDSMSYTAKGEPESDSLDSSAKSLAQKRRARVFVLQKPPFYLGMNQNLVDCAGVIDAPIDTVIYTVQNEVPKKIQGDRHALLRGENGIEVFIPAASEGSGDIRVEVSLFKNLDDMLRMGMPTATASEALTTDGVFEVRVFKDDKMLRVIPEGTEVRIPFGRFASKMKLWAIGGNQQAGPWVESKEGSIRVDEESGTYVIGDLRTMQRCNLDCLLTDAMGGVGGNQVPVFIKVKRVRRKDIPNTRFTCKLDDFQSILTAVPIKKRLFKLQVPLYGGISGDLEANALSRGKAKSAQTQFEISANRDKEVYKMKLKRRKQL